MLCLAGKRTCSFPAALILAACATPNIPKDYPLSEASGKGVVVATIVSSGVYADYRIYYRQIGKRQVGYFQLKSADPSFNGALIAAELVEGDYEIYDWRILWYGGRADWTAISPTMPFSIPFHVSRGEPTYVGSCTFQLIAGGGYVRGAGVECAKWPDRDLPLLQERYPGLTEIMKTANAQVLYRSGEYNVRNFERPMDAGGSLCDR